MIPVGLIPTAESSDGWMANFVAGHDLVMPFLENRGIEQIDTVLHRHARSDHLGGF